MKPAQAAQRKKTFLDALAGGDPVTQASETCGVPRRTLYDWRKADSEFAAAWDEAVDQGTDQLETEARRRALDGSDTLLIFLLKARRPGVYRDNVKIEHAGSKDQPVIVEHRRRLTLEDVSELASRLRPGESTSGALPTTRPVLPDT